VEFSEYSKILIIRLSSLGDILLTTPVISAIKVKYPQVKIDFLCRSEYKDVLENNPKVDNLIKLDRNYSLRNIRKTIRENKYDLIIDLQNNLRSKFISFKIARRVHYKKPYLKRFLLVNLKINKYRKTVTIPERYAEAFSDLNVASEDLELYLPEDNEIRLNNAYSYIGFCPGSRHITKMWPKEYFIELGNLLTEKGHKIVLFGGSEDRNICREICSEISGSIDLSNNNDLFSLAGNMQYCKLVICNDSGLMHTSVAMKVPVIAIFGSTVREFGFYPYGGKNLVLENKSLSCRPCSHIGRDSCPKGHLNCLKEITPAHVLKEFNKFINTI
jgi:heptosyltransferase-2